MKRAGDVLGIVGRKIGVVAAVLVMGTACGGSKAGTRTTNTGGALQGGGGAIGSGGMTALGDGAPEALVTPCRDMTTQAACDARGDCHAVFVIPGTCSCAPAGCCAEFGSCADGDKATCTGVVFCEVAPPLCEGPYVVSYRGSCYEGCVRKTDCAP